MMRLCLSATILSAAVLLAGHEARAGGEKRAPFQIPRHGKPVVLVHPPRGHGGYSIYYHRMFIDRHGALYASFTFYETRTKEKGQYPRVLAVSDDRGATWRLATTESFIKRVNLEKQGKRSPAADRLKAPPEE